MQQQRGFTLVELMVTVAIMALLLLAAMPFTRDWVDGNRQMQVRNQLWEAVAQARSLALRNPDRVVGGDTLAAQLKFDGGVLQVSDNDGSVIWQASLAGSPLLKRTSAAGFADAVALKGSSAGFTCLAFNNRGQRVDSACGAGAIGSADTRIAVGVRNQEPMYVDLL